MSVPATPLACDAAVELWRLALDAPGAGGGDDRALLSVDERRRISRAAPEVGRRLAAARAGLRRLLARHLGLAPEVVRLELGPEGKPEVPGGPAFNVSHAGGLALVAVARGRQVGVDVEALRPVPEAESIAREWFSPEEQAALAAAPRDEADTLFLLLWTRREAWLKAQGVGLSGPGARAPIDPARWEVHELHPDAGHVGALVLEGLASAAPEIPRPSPAGASNGHAPAGESTP